jgi:hypothetical protein
VSKIDDLVATYERFVGLPWERNLAGPQKCWFAVYDPRDERRLRARLDAFELATTKAEHGWLPCDITDAFAHWIAAERERDSFFEMPEDLNLVLGDFRASLAAQVRAVLEDQRAGEDSVVAILGVGSLFGLSKVAALMQDVAPAIRGRLLVFFPGEYEGNNYRLMDGHDGWNYMAVPIVAERGS